MENSKANEEIVATQLKGNTLRVCWCVLRFAHSSVGPMAVQRGLGFSSPTPKVYHLEKLADLGLVEKNHGKYHVIKEVKLGF